MYRTYIESCTYIVESPLDVGFYASLIFTAVFSSLLCPPGRLHKKHSVPSIKIVKYPNYHKQLLKIIPEADVHKQTIFIKITVGRNLLLFCLALKEIKKAFYNFDYNFKRGFYCIKDVVA